MTITSAAVVLDRSIKGSPHVALTFAWDDEEHGHCSADFTFHSGYGLEGQRARRLAHSEFVQILGVCLSASQTGTMDGLIGRPAWVTLTDGGGIETWGFDLA